MGFRNQAYATVWSVEQGAGNFTKVRLSISRKNKNGEWEQDFAGYCMFIGTAHAKAEKLREKDRIRLGEVDVSNFYDKEKKKEYTNFKVFDFEFADASDKPAAKRVESNPVEGDVGDDEAPF